MSRESLEQEPKIGHWIVHKKPYGIRYLECSHCHIWYLNEHLIRNNFCPNCGYHNMIETLEMRLINVDALIERLKIDSPDPEGVDEWIDIINDEYNAESEG